MNVGNSVSEVDVGDSVSEVDVGDFVSEVDTEKIKINDCNDR